MSRARLSRALVKPSDCCWANETQAEAKKKIKTESRVKNLLDTKFFMADSPHIYFI
jgi:hypothetical protein